MTIYGLKLNWIIGGLLILTFAFLLTLRLGLLEEGGVDHIDGRISHVATKTDQETWMNIFQQGAKIGYTHRQSYKTVEGYKVLESVFMQINIMGMLQDIRFRTEGNVFHDLTLSSFDFELESSLFHFRARGFRKGKVLNLFTGKPGFEQEIDLPLEKETYLFVGVLEALTHEDVKPGVSRTFHVFDPTTATQRPVKITYLAEEMIPIMGHQEKAKKVSVDFMILKGLPTTL